MTLCSLTPPPLKVKVLKYWRELILLINFHAKPTICYFAWQVVSFVTLATGTHRNK